MIPNWRKNVKPSLNEDVNRSASRAIDDDKLRDDIQQWVSAHLLDTPDSEFLMADGMDEAFVGYVEGGNTSPVAVYDMSMILEILERDMSRLEAIEFFNFNILGAYVGPQTPLFLRRYKK